MAGVGPGAGGVGCTMKFTVLNDRDFDSGKGTPLMKHVYLVRKVLNIDV